MLSILFSEEEQLQSFAMQLLSILSQVMTKQMNDQHNRMVNILFELSNISYDQGLLNTLPNNVENTILSSLLKILPMDNKRGQKMEHILRTLIQYQNNKREYLDQITKQSKAKENLIEIA
jgi:hypothetical protein